jgi:hypothetical protein
MGRRRYTHFKTECRPRPLHVRTFESTLRTCDKIRKVDPPWWHMVVAQCPPWYHQIWFSLTWQLLLGACTMQCPMKPHWPWRAWRLIHTFGFLPPALLPLEICFMTLSTVLKQQLCSFIDIIWVFLFRRAVVTVKMGGNETGRCLQYVLSNEMFSLFIFMHLLEYDVIAFSRSIGGKPPFERWHFPLATLAWNVLFSYYSLMFLNSAFHDEARQFRLVSKRVCFHL